jgi:hypothetical protein
MVNHKDTKDTKIEMGSFGKFPCNNEFTFLPPFLPITPSPFPRAERMASFRTNRFKGRIQSDCPDFGPFSG